jgi:hypothetical protein
MRLALIVSLLLILASCGGGGSRPRTGQPDAPAGGVQQPGQPQPDPAAGSLRVTLTSEQDGNDWRVTLTAPSASDLYQIGGTLAFDSAKYEVVSIEAGGGLGQPGDSYFVGKESSPGKVGFAYTKRYWGSGASGKLALVSLRVRPVGAFSLTDFKLDPAAKLLARDSQRRVMRVDGGAQ